MGSNLSEKEISVENRKSEHRHSILHIEIILSTKFQLKGTTDFLDQIWPERVFVPKIEKPHFGMRPQSLLIILNFFT